MAVFDLPLLHVHAGFPMLLDPRGSLLGRIRCASEASAHSL